VAAADLRAAGEADLEPRGRRLHLVDPELHHGDDVQLPRMVEFALRRLHVDDFLELHVA
jgi:hypothetical protein